MSSRPTVGVTGPRRGGFVAWSMTALALRRCGARPVRITPGSPVDESRLDALVIGGGTDVDPLQYGAERDEEEEEPAASPYAGSPYAGSPYAGSPYAGRPYTLLDWAVGLLVTGLRILFARHTPGGYDPGRDALETRLIRWALYQDLPILGICRGAQLMNVVLGGSLHRDIGHFYTEDTRNVRSILPAKSIALHPQTRLREILGTDACRVNALHNQSVDRLGDGVRVSALEPSGVVQAIERSQHPYFIGVQWHPEYIPQSRTQQRLFRSLVARARGG